MSVPIPDLTFRGGAGGPSGAAGGRTEVFSPFTVGGAGGGFAGQVSAVAPWVLVGLALVLVLRRR